MSAIVHTLDWRRRVYRIKLGLLGLLAVAGIVALLLARAVGGHASVHNEGPLDIRLVGVRPDGGDELYDAEGRKLEAALAPLGMEDATWNQDQQRRDFVFQVPAVQEPLLFLPFPRLCLAGTDYVRVARLPDELDPAEGACTLVASGTFDRIYRSSWLHLLTLTSPIDKIDLTLQYFYGPRREALCTFTGPFQVGQTVAADEGRPYQLTPQPAEAWKEIQVKFRFVTGQPFSSDTPILFYDKQGRRYYVRSGVSGRSGGIGADLTYNVEVLPWDEVAAITVGEKPYAITFRNVTVAYPQRPPCTYAASWDQMAGRLGLTRLSPESFTRYQFASASEAVSMLDLVRNLSQMTKVLQALATSRKEGDWAALDEAARDKIRRTATQWLQSPGAMGRACGAQLGLLGGFREFVDPAFALLEYRHPTQGYMTMAVRNIVLTGLRCWYTDHRIADDLERLKRIARQGDHGAVWSELFRACLVYPDHPVDTEMLWELAQEDPPWVWWPALRVLLEREDLRSRGYPTWPQKMKLRLLLVGRGEQPDQAQLLPQARLLLAGLFTPETLRMAPELMMDLHTAVTTCLGRKEATVVYMDFLRAALQPATCRQFEVEDGSFHALNSMLALLLRDLNAWYGLNLGGLGVFQTGQINEGFRSPGESVKAVAAALDWYRANGGTPPIEPILEARVVDTDDRGIPDATITLRRRRLVFDEVGQRRATTTELGTLQTDADGRAVFRNLPAGGEHDCDIWAERFAPRKHVSLERLPDGRFQIHAGAADNVIVLDQAAGLSGLVLGADGRPLARALVQVLSYSPHASLESRTVQTDAQGRFATGPVIGGYHLLLCCHIGPPARDEEPGRVKALQLVRVKEGQTVEDMTLDLREATATLEVQVVGDMEESTRMLHLILEVAIPFAQPQYAPAMSLHGVESQTLQRFSNLPPLEGYLRVLGLPPQAERVPLRLVAGRTTRCRIGPERIEISTDVGPAQPQTSEKPKEEGSSGGALVR